MMEVTYYECHITLTPESGAALTLLKGLAQDHAWKVANFLLKEDSDAPPKMFLSARGAGYKGLHDAAQRMYKLLCEHSFTVTRIKIEATIFDMKLVNLSSATCVGD